MSIRYEYMWAIVKDGKVIDTWYSKGGAKGAAMKIEGATIKRILVEVVNPLAVAAMADQPK